MRPLCHVPRFNGAVALHHGGLQLSAVRSGYARHDSKCDVLTRTDEALDVAADGFLDSLFVEPCRRCHPNFDTGRGRVGLSVPPALPKGRRRPVLGSGIGRPSAAVKESSTRPSTSPSKGNDRPHGQGWVGAGPTSSPVRYRNNGKPQLCSGVPTNSHRDSVFGTGNSSTIP